MVAGEVVLQKQLDEFRQELEMEKALRDKPSVQAPLPTQEVIKPCKFIALSIYYA